MSFSIVSEPSIVSCKIYPEENFFSEIKESIIRDEMGIDFKIRVTNNWSFLKYEVFLSNEWVNITEPLMFNWVTENIF